MTESSFEETVQKLYCFGSELECNGFAKVFCYL